MRDIYAPLKQTTQNYSYILATQTTENIPDHGDENLENPYAVLFVALVPGFFLHGLGHLYIGEKKTASILLGIEGITGFGMFSFMTYYFTRYFFECALGGEQDCFDNNKGLQNTGTVFATVYVVSFLGTWLYDVVVAPIKAKRKKSMLEKSNAKNLIPELAFKFSMNFSGCTLALNWRF